MKVMLYVIFALVMTAGIAASEEYSHKYSTFEISFITLPGDTASIQWGDNGAGNETANGTIKLITMELSRGESLFVIPHNPTTWQKKDISKENLVKLWNHDADGNMYSIPAITRLGSGDFLVTGHMMFASNYITRTMRTFDFDNDDRVDFYVLWNANGKADTDLMNYLAANTDVYLSGS